MKKFHESVRHNRLFIEEGWYVDELETLDQLDEADTAINLIIADIEHQIDLEDLENYPDKEWRAGAKRALKVKRVVAQAINRRRASIARQHKETVQGSRDRALIDYLRTRLGKDEWLEITSDFETVLSVVAGEAA